MNYKDEAITMITRKWFNYYFEKVNLKDNCKYVFPMIWISIIFDVKTWFYYKHWYKEYKIKEIKYTFDYYLNYLDDINKKLD